MNNTRRIQKPSGTHSVVLRTFSLLWAIDDVYAKIMEVYEGELVE